MTGRTDAQCQEFQSATEGGKSVFPLVSINGGLTVLNHVV